ncbi:potassium transporter Kef [Arthrobacter sp. MYb211]|uniref:cation:proton antiporter n=1 Tax=Micrococcaceae TaxID=1268 RepID=UPI000CFB4916|nr:MULTISPECIES: cation:proton antiporter [unclassified Arthrobacter]PRA10246.1 potassium transporter Kef [Arthrobacter sp. MYb221]PRC05626.1 potassium transporter Kef [Arthrobacter sp. MYb211]
MHHELVENLTSVWWIALAAAVAPLLAIATRRYAPDVVWLLAFGTLIGPNLLGLAEQTEAVGFLRELGMGFLFLLAGFEVNTADMRAAQGKRAAATWMICAALGIGASFFIVQGDWPAAIAFGIASTSTALGTLLPILKDSGTMDTALGKAVMVHGAYGELLPIVAMSLLLSTRGTWVAAGLLVLFALIAVMAIAIPARFFRRVPLLARAFSKASNSTMQTMMRLTVLLLVSLMLVTAVFELDVALGAFAAGILANAVLKAVKAEHAAEVMHKVEIVGFSFLIPVFFVTSGMNINLAQVAAQWPMLLGFVALIILVRGLPVFLRERFAPRSSGRGGTRESLALGFYAATGLPIIVAVTQLAASSGILSEVTVSVMVTGGALTVLIFPAAAKLLAR